MGTLSQINLDKIVTPLKGEVKTHRLLLNSPFGGKGAYHIPKPFRINPMLLFSIFNNIEKTNSKV